MWVDLTCSKCCRTPPLVAIWRRGQDGTVIIYRVCCCAPDVRFVRLRSREEGGPIFFSFFGLQGVRAGGVSVASYCTPFFLFHLGGRRKRKRNQEVAERRKRVVKRSPECRVVAIRSRWKINWKGFLFFIDSSFHFFLTFPLCLLLLLPHHMIAAHTKGPSLLLKESTDGLCQSCRFLFLIFFKYRRPAGAQYLASLSNSNSRLILLCELVIILIRSVYTVLSGERKKEKKHRRARRCITKRRKRHPKLLTVGPPAVFFVFHFFFKKNLYFNTSEDENEAWTLYTVRSRARNKDSTFICIHGRYEKRPYKKCFFFVGRSTGAVAPTILFFK